MKFAQPRKKIAISCRKTLRSGGTANDFTSAVDDERVRHVVHVQRPRKFPVGIQQDVVLPAYTVDVRSHAIHRTHVVDADRDNSDIGLVYPVLIKLGVVVQLSLARAAPGCPKAKDCGPFMVEK